METSLFDKYLRLCTVTAAFRHSLSLKHNMTNCRIRGLETLFLIVPTRSKGMQPETLRVPKRTQSVH
ncbi:hypothetical protein PspS49_19855 [Pseudomonas sp. S49]|nr:hypothetical protein PspS49_19855 [Pseudomonas sp. S49]